MRGGARTTIIGLALAVGLVAAAGAAGAKGGATDDAGQGAWLGRRTTADGVVLRVTTTPVNETVPPEINGVALPADCFPNELVNVGVSTRRIAQSATSTFRTASDETTVSAPIVGTNGAYQTGGGTVDVVQVVIVRTPKGAKSVTAAAAGWEDEAKVRGRYAVLARKARWRFGVAEPPSRNLVEVTVRDGDGTVMDRATGSFGDSQDGFLDYSRPECRPTGTNGGASVIIATPTALALPDPVGPPPADEEAARQAVIDAIEGAYRGNEGNDLDHVQDGDSPAVREATEKAAAANPQYAGRVTAVVTEVRFLDAREAAVRFEFRLDGEPFYSPQVGFAVLTDDGWR